VPGSRAVAFQTFLGKALGVLAGVVFALSWVVGVTRDRWSTPTPDALHTYPVRFKGGYELFFRAALGWFLNYALWLFLAAVLLAVLAEWVGRRRRSRPQGLAG